ncbi:hypothetical protein AAFM37_28485, partial [Klebsiella pneumoniae]
LLDLWLPRVLHPVERFTARHPRRTRQEPGA